MEEWIKLGILCFVGIYATYQAFRLDSGSYKKSHKRK